jgi:tRNA-splicing ligase RtcB
VGQPAAAIVEAWAGLAVRFARICDKHPRLKNTNNLTHLGTLGTGNHRTASTRTRGCG